MIALDESQFGPLTADIAQSANLSASISRACAIAAHTRTHSIADVEHVVVLSLGNRSFDYYFGTLNGVRGFSDPRVARLAGGAALWTHADSGAARSYLTRVELSFLFALADAFTICDAYYGTVFETSVGFGSLGASAWMGDLSADAGAAKSSEPSAAKRLANFADLELGNISSAVYRDRGPARHGVCSNVFEVFREDVLCARLPQVSWISLPDIYASCSTMPGYDSAWDIAQVLDALTANPDVWSRSVLFINAEQAEGYCDRLVPPQPAAGATETPSLGTKHQPHAFAGMGMRVPMLVASPWSRGGFVNSQVFDHSSIMRFIERRFSRDPLTCQDKNVSRRQRAVAGDLTSAFNFGRPNAPLSALSSTMSYLPARKARHPDDIVVSSVVAEHPRQERAVRRARALPYRLEVRGMLQPMSDNFVIEFSNRGQSAAVFQVCATGCDLAPRDYTVEAGGHLRDSWALPANGCYDFTVHGPNGFLRAFKGRVLAADDALLEAHIECRHEGKKELSLAVANFGKAAETIRIRDSYTGEVSCTSLNPDDVLAHSHGCVRQLGWYDLLVTSDEDANFSWRFAGHIEDGRDSISDPALGRGTIED